MYEFPGQRIEGPALQDYNPTERARRHLMQITLEGLVEARMRAFSITTKLLFISLSNESDHKVLIREQHNQIIVWSKTKTPLSIQKIDLSKGGLLRAYCSVQRKKKKTLPARSHVLLETWNLGSICKIRNRCLEKREASSIVSMFFFS